MSMSPDSGASTSRQAPRRPKDVLEFGVPPTELLSEEFKNRVEAAVYAACYDPSGPSLAFEALESWPSEFRAMDRVFGFDSTQSLRQILFRGVSGGGVCMSLDGEAPFLRSTVSEIAEKVGAAQPGLQDLGSRYMPASCSKPALNYMGHLVADREK
jgi:hypothetical protein